MAKAAHQEQHMFLRLGLHDKQQFLNQIQSATCKASGSNAAGADEANLDYSWTTAGLQQDYSRTTAEYLKQRDPKHCAVLLPHLPNVAGLCQ